MRSENIELPFTYAEYLKYAHGNRDMTTSQAGGQLPFRLTKEYLEDAVTRCNIGDPPRLLNSREQRSLLRHLMPFAFGMKHNKHTTVKMIKRLINEWANAQN